MVRSATVNLEADREASRPYNIVQLWHACPWADDVTAYDRKNITLYGLLLDAELEGASEFEMAAVFFNMRVHAQPDRALLVVRTHLSRAHWLKANYFPLLNW